MPKTASAQSRARPSQGLRRVANRLNTTIRYRRLASRPPGYHPREGRYHAIRPFTARVDLSDPPVDGRVVLSYLLRFAAASDERRRPFAPSRASRQRLFAAVPRTLKSKRSRFHPTVVLLAMLADEASERGGFTTSFRVWDMTTRRVRLSGSFPDEHLAWCGQMFEGMRRISDRLWQIGFSPDGKFLAAGAVGCRTIKVWEVATV